jgi:hypothetical protein
LPPRLAAVSKMTERPACNLIPLLAELVLIRINELLEKARFNPPTPNGAQSMNDFRASQHVSLTEPSAVRRVAVGALRIECVAERLGLAGLVGQERARAEEIPSSWACVNTFAHARKPEPLCLPHGRAVEVRDGMREFIRV